MDSLAVVDDLTNVTSQCCVVNVESVNQDGLSEATGLKQDHEGADIGEVAVKVLWDTQESTLESFSELGNESRVKTELDEMHVDTEEQSLSVDDGGNLVSSQGHQLVTSSQASITAEEHQIVGSDGEILTEGHMLHVPEGDTTILAGVSSTIQVATSLASALTAHSDQEVIRLLLPTDEQANEQLQPSEQLTSGQTVIAEQTTVGTVSTVQAITLADGTTAFIQHPNGKFLEGQTITLEDGTTAVVQGIPNKLNLVTSTAVPSTSGTVSIDNSKTTVLTESHSVQLEDGTTAYLNHPTKDSLQAIILEDGTTAYLATQQTPLPTFTEIPTLEATTLSLDQLTTQVSGVQALLTNGIIKTTDIKPAVTTTAVQVQQVGNTSTEKTIPFGEKAYKCDFEDCGRLYTTLHHLKVHERSHTGDRPFKCEESGCGKAFATGYGLKSHTRVHTGEKPYKCLESPCDKAFKTSGDLQKHLRTHTGERPFKCPFEGCTRSFTTSNIRKVHIRTHTGERPYVCPEDGCGRAFASATNYKNHIRIHTGEKPYVCTVQGCGKRFTEYSSLYKHHVVHTHSKPYICNHCGKTYRQTSTLAMHKRTAHGEDVTTESEAAYFAQAAEDADLPPEPPEKRPRQSFPLQAEAASSQEEGEGTLVINTSESNQSLTLVGTDNLNIATEVQGDSTLQSSTAGAGNPTSLLQQAGVATFNLQLGDQGQQVYVITDTAQLEALQQLAQQQFDTEALDSSIITSLPSVSTTLSDVVVDGVSTTVITAASQDGAIPFETE